MKPNLRSKFNARVLQAFDGGPSGSGVQFRAAAAEKPAEILIYDFIGSDGWGGGVEPAAIVAALAAADGGPVTVRINSPGGSVFDGLAIYNALLNYHGELHTVVDGVAASAASFIAIAGKTMTMQDASIFMIHNASTLEWGDKRAMAAAANVLGIIDAQLAGIYANKTGKPAESMAALMDAETYMTGADALAGGFCDAVMPPPEKVKPAATIEDKPIVAVIPDVTAAADTRSLQRLRMLEAESH